MSIFHPNSSNLYFSKVFLRSFRPSMVVVNRIEDFFLPGYPLWNKQFAPVGRPVSFRDGLFDWVWFLRFRGCIHAISGFDCQAFGSFLVLIAEVHKFIVNVYVDIFGAYGIDMFLWFEFEIWSVDCFGQMCGQQYHGGPPFFFFSAAVSPIEPGSKIYA